MTRHTKKRIKLKSIYCWHRHLGLLASLLVLILSITGIMLNHTDSLQLQTQYLNNKYLLNWYGIRIPTNINNFHINQHHISQIDDKLFFNGQYAGEYKYDLVGVVAFNEIIVIAFRDKLLLLTTDLELIEILDESHGLPVTINRLGTSVNDEIFIHTKTTQYISNTDLITWEPNKDNMVIWSTQSTLPVNIADVIITKNRNHSINYERLLLDIHSGRILGKWGIYVMDFAAVILLFLSMSGSILWLVRLRKQRQHQAY